MWFTVVDFGLLWLTLVFSALTNVIMNDFNWLVLIILKVGWLQSIMVQNI